MRPMVRPWSPIWVVAAIATSSIRSGAAAGLRRSSSRMTRDDQVVGAGLGVDALGPALPNGVRTPSTKTTALP